MGEHQEHAGDADAVGEAASPSPRAPAGDDPGRGGDADPAGPDPSSWSAWGNLWQVPAIVLSVLLIAGGLHVASRRRPPNDFAGVLDEVDRMISAQDLARARARLQRTIEPNLGLAPPSQVARYHATVADWVAVSQVARGVSVEKNNRIIADQYRTAVESGLVPSPRRLERWAEALIDLDELDGARQRLTQLEALSATDAAGADARRRRNRVLRHLIEHSLARHALPLDQMMASLAEYRSDPLLEVADRAWIAAQAAQLRLAAGEAVEAVTHLLVDMRRLEERPGEVEPATWGELYALLGRGYFEQGRYELAVERFDEALRRLVHAEPQRAGALLGLGRIDQARGDLETARDRYDEIVRDYVGTPSFLPALLGRAEVAGIMGDHATALADFRSLVRSLPAGGADGPIDRSTVAVSLSDRHDAALTRGELPLAMEYVGLAESLFERGAVPPGVLRRIASTSRQIADNVLADATAGPDGVARRPEEIDPQLRAVAAEHYRRAGDDFLRHARAVAAVPDADEQWAESLWLSGDSYDRAGLRTLAIRQFLEYIAGRTVDDPRRAEVSFRLAQAYQAGEDYAAALEAYTGLLAEHPRSTFGTRSHVPMARCLVALGREADAKKELVAVVDGRGDPNSPLTPDAVDYREALIELGRMDHDAGRYREAIERLDTAVARYPDDERINEVIEQLADSHRRYALALRAELAAEPALSPQDRQARGQRADEHLEQALALFTRAVKGYDAFDPRRLDRLQRESRRSAVMERADCAYDLGQYELAADLYDQAARRYRTHHSSMQALVQIVNCYDRLGRTADADIAHHNALTRLRQLPDDAFDDPAALMDRAAWEQWLQNRPVGLARAEETPSGP